MYPQGTCNKAPSRDEYRACLSYDQASWMKTACACSLPCFTGRFGNSKPHSNKAPLWYPTYLHAHCYWWSKCELQLGPAGPATGAANAEMAAIIRLPALISINDKCFEIADNHVGPCFLAPLLL